MCPLGGEGGGGRSKQDVYDWNSESPSPNDCARNIEGVHEEMFQGADPNEANTLANIEGVGSESKTQRVFELKSF